MYEIVEVGGSKTEEPTEVIKFTNEDGQEFWIPVDEANADYQQYLLSLEEQA